MDLKQIMTGKNPQAVVLEQTRGLKAKWEKTGLLEGVGSETSKHGMAVMLENQAKQLLDEATRTGTSAGSEEWAGVALPLVRRIFGSIAAKEFVSVQPMNLPSGLIFYMDFKYSTDQAGTPTYSGSSMFGALGTFGKDSLDANANKLGSTQAAEGGLYGAGRFGYSINDTTIARNATVGTASIADIAFDLSDSVLSASLAADKVRKLTVALPTDADWNGVRAFELTQSGSGFVMYPQFTVKNGSNVTFVAAYTAANPLAGDATVGSTLAYHKQPTDITRGDFEDRGAGNGSPDLGIPEIELELKSEPIVAKTRKLKAIWTPELAQDLNAYHSVDAEAELTQMLSEYISLEIDLEILEMLQQNAFSTEYWSARVGYDWNGATFAVDSTAVAAGAYTKNTWYQTLGIKLQKISNKIHQLTMRGGANFIVVSPNVATILESMNGFSANPGKDAMQFAAGVTNIGSISNRYDVYKNPYMTENVILLGFKGSNFFETGAVYAPYVPLIMTPLVYDPVNFTPRRGVMTRYAKKMVRPEFYGKIIVDGLNTL
jgi:hypothetical protein